MDIDHAARELIRQALSAAAELSVGLVNLWLEEAVNGKGGMLTSTSPERAVIRNKYTTGGNAAN